MRKILTILLITSIMLISTASDNYIVNQKVPYEVVQKPVSVETVIVDTYFNIPLNHSIQDFTRSQSEYMKVPYELVIAIMDIESGFDATEISETNDYGLMQINKSNHAELERVYGDLDFLDENDNIISGIYILNCAYSKYKDLNMALMVYNLGEKGAIDYWNDGIYQTDYTIKVLDKYETYRNPTEISGR